MNCNQQTSLKFTETQRQLLSAIYGGGFNDSKADGYLNMGIKNQGSVKESNTHATIGKGNIEVADGSDIAGVNRDVNKTETVTRDEITGALDATVSVDNRIITGSFSEWWDNVYNKNAENYDERNEAAQDYFKADYKGEEKDLSLLPTVGLEKSYVGRETYVMGRNDLTEAYKTKYAVTVDGEGNAFDKNRNSLTKDKFTAETNERGETIYYQAPDQLNWKQKLESDFDLNPAFKFLDAVIPGFNSDAKVHDAEYEGEDRQEVLRNSIIPSFIATDFLIIFGKVPSLLKKNKGENK